MYQEYWRKQSSAGPLFPDMLWSRPENRSVAGKLLVVGGHAQGFTRPAQAFSIAEASGVGSVRVLLPDVLQKTLGRAFLGAEFGPSTPSGTFAANTLGEIVPLSDGSDGVLIAGDLGRNSETAIMLEKFAGHYAGQLTITCDAVDYFVATPYPLMQRPNTLLVLSFAQLQKLGVAVKYSNAFTFSMDLLRLIDALHEFTKRYKLIIITRHLDTMILADAGQVITTRLSSVKPVWRLQTASKASVWWLQNPAKTLESLATSIFETVDIIS